MAKIDGRSKRYPSDFADEEWGRLPLFLSGPAGSAGEVARNLAGRTMALAPDDGGAHTTQSNVTAMGMRDGDLTGVSTDKTTPDQRQSIKIAHEGLHSPRIDAALAGGSGPLGGAPGQDAHQIPYNNAAMELLDIEGSVP